MCIYVVYIPLQKKKINIFISYNIAVTRVTVQNISIVLEIHMAQQPTRYFWILVSITLRGLFYQTGLLMISRYVKLKKKKKKTSRRDNNTL